MKKIKPELIDPYMEKKIIKTLKPKNVDNWEPVKNAVKTFYHNYIRDNIGLCVIILLVIIFFIYRYRYVKKNKEMEMLQQIYINKPEQYYTPPPTYQITNPNSLYGNPNPLINPLYGNSNSLYSNPNILINPNLYKDQIQISEKNDKKTKKKKSESSKMAYPIFPYHQDDHFYHQ